MTADGGISSGTLAEHQIVSTRVIAAKREKVFEAFANPDHLARWWGPKGFTNTFEQFDFWPGGDWRFVMHGPDGVKHPNHNVFEAIVQPQRIVFKHISGHEFQMTITLVDESGKTAITWQMLFASATECP